MPVRPRAQRRQPAGACAAGAAGAGRRRAAPPASYSRCCSSLRSRAASAWTTTRWRRCTSGCARPASIGRWMRRSAPASSLPAQPRHTLADALQRLFLGYALPAQARSLSTACSAPGDAEGSRATALGALWRFAHRLQRAHDEMQLPKLPDAWAACAVRAARRLRASRRRRAGRSARTASRHPATHRGHARRWRRAAAAAGGGLRARCSSGSTTRQTAASPAAASTSRR